jgi:hypothetical protein
MAPKTIVRIPRIPMIIEKSNKTTELFPRKLAMLFIP